MEEIPSNGHCVIACSATGGRHPITLGILDTLENELLHPMGYEPFRIGSSGGTMACVARTMTPPGEKSVWWLEKAAKESAIAKIGGWRIPWNIYHLIVHGGLIYSKDIIKAFEKLFDGPFVNGRASACTFSITSRYEARVELDQETMTMKQIAEWIAASATLPLAVSPTEILNRSLPLWLQKKWNVVEHPDEYTACGDGGIGSYMPVSVRGLQWHVPEGSPVIGVCLDPIGPCEYRPEGLIGPIWKGGNPFTKLWRGCWSVVGANATEDWQKAVADSDINPAFLLSMPTPEHFAKYELRLDTTLEEAMEMYEYGVMETQRRLQLPMPGTDGKTLKEALESLKTTR